MTKRKMVLKRHNGKVVACTTDLADFCDGARHWHFMTACQKAIEKAIKADPDVGTEDFIPATYTGRNGQENDCYFVTRSGVEAMCQHLRGMAEHQPRILGAYDDCEKKLETKAMLAAAIGAVTPAVFPHKTSGRWTVASRELAALTAHLHSNILGAVRLAEQGLAESGSSGGVFWSQYYSRKSGRWFPCCHITREVMAQIRLHNVPGCRNVRGVLDEYIRLLDERENPRHDDVAALVAAEPAPDSEIRPPDPEPAETLETVPPLPAEKVTAHLSMSWLIDQAVARNALVDMPERLLADLIDWNKQRRQQLFLSLFKPGGAEQAAPSTKPIHSFRRDDSLGLGDCH